MFDPAYNARSIAARRRITGNPWFKRGNLFRAALDVLRAAQGPLTVQQIADAMLTAKGVKEPTRKQRSGIEAGVWSSLENHNGKTVEFVGSGPLLGDDMSAFLIALMGLVATLALLNIRQHARHTLSPQSKRLR
jgi:hypothetical protein